jgi:hypothetical protein
MKKYLLRILLIVITASWLSACNNVTQANFDKIQPGMTTQQVNNILGQPTSAQSIALMGISGTASVWKNGDTEITITFINDIVKVKTFNKINTSSSSNKLSD